MKQHLKMYTVNSIKQTVEIVVKNTDTVLKKSAQIKNNVKNVIKING